MIVVPPLILDFISEVGKFLAELVSFDAGTVENLGPLGAVGKIGWWVPSYVIDENPELATWEGFSSPEAAELKKKSAWNRRFFYAKTEKVVIAPEVWHDLAVEVRGKELRVSIDAQPVLQYTTLSGDVPKTSIGFGVGGNGKTVLATWYDDVSIEPLGTKREQ